MDGLGYGIPRMVECGAVRCGTVQVEVRAMGACRVVQ
jgi:hypothetical protein